MTGAGAGTGAGRCVESDLTRSSAKWNFSDRAETEQVVVAQEAKQGPEQESKEREQQLRAQSRRLSGWDARRQRRKCFVG